MPLIKKLSKIGNSQGIIIPQPVLDQLNWSSDTEVELKVQGTELVVAIHPYVDDAEFKKSTKKVFAERKRLLRRLAR
jgi:antitoxin component of MazEF toxin-antitoxin module